MEPYMKDFGKIIYTTVEANFITQVEISMKENLWTTWLKALAFTNMLTAASTSATGTKTSNTASAKKNGMT